MIKAKAVVPDQYWILKDQQNKVGNIQAVGDGYSICINNRVATFKTLTSLCKQVPVDFEMLPRDDVNPDEHQAHGYPTSHRVHNAVWDVKKQVPLWTRDPRSKSWFAAGWFKVKQHRDWKVVFCPKAILLDRYKYQGPYYTKQEAQA